MAVIHELIIRSKIEGLRGRDEQVGRKRWAAKRRVAGHSSRTGPAGTADSSSASAAAADDAVEEVEAGTLCRQAHRTRTTSSHRARKTMKEGVPN